ncbi:MAG: DUF2946 family protein [Burkholderiales bacterium]
MTRLQRRFTAWLALAALLFNAAAPGLAAALVPLQAQPYAEICTPAGIQRVAVGDNVPALPEGPVTPAQKHCALCLAGGVAGALPSPDLTYGVPEADQTVFLDAAQYPRPSSARDRVAAPRGPPCYS